MQTNLPYKDTCNTSGTARIVIVVGGVDTYIVPLDLVAVHISYIVIVDIHQ